MIYITYQDLCFDIRSNLWKIPHDVCGVVGVPRSGMLAASIIAEYLNVGLASLDALVADSDALQRHGGRRLRNTEGNKLLVVDDTCYCGNAKKVVEEHYLNLPVFEKYEIIYLVVYLEGPCTKAKPDIWLRDIRREAESNPFGWAIYEWNLIAHGRLTDHTLFDLDGVIVAEPPDERDVARYEAYIENPRPLFIPTGNAIAICTYRLEKYRDVTLASLARLGLHNVKLFMAKDRSVRPSDMKASIYSDPRWMLFVESSPAQALSISISTLKPVICTTSNEMTW